MKKIIMFAACAVASIGLAGCADKQIATDICSHQIATTIAANEALSNAALIKDPVARQAAIDAANTLLMLVAQCPAVGTPVSP